MPLLKKGTIRALVVATGLFNAYYIWWRSAFTLNEAALIFSIVFLIAEIHGLINFYLFSMMTWNTQPRKRPAPFEGANVDVFVPTYNEDIKVLEATLVGCKGIRYPHTTYVLDDGNRPEVKALAQRIGCEYLYRTENKHAKAGNINEALRKTKGQFVVVLDADMVPQPDFIDKTIGYFKDPKVAIVQLPQEFYNLDSVQHSKMSYQWHEQQLFYHVIQPGKDRINAAFWCGSPSIIRRDALEDIGGVATQSVTEDFLTSIRLNAKGWQIRYHNEVLAYGIAPQSLNAFNVQRLRWAQGSMKIFFSSDNPLFKRGLTIRQRLSHFAAIFTYFDAYQKLIFILAPLVLLVTGMMPVKVTSGYEFLLHWVPYILLTTLSIKLLGRGYFKIFAVEQYNMLKMVTFIKASLTFFLPKRNIFRVTPKTVEKSLKKQDRRELKIQIVILAVIALCVIYAAVNTAWGIVLTYSNILGAWVAMFWACFNGFVLFFALRSVLKRMYDRQDYRFPVKMRSQLYIGGAAYSLTVSDISSGGLKLSGIKTNFFEKEKRADLCLPDGSTIIPGTVVYNRKEKDGTSNVGIRFLDLSAEQKENLYSFIYVTIPRKMQGVNLTEKSPVAENGSCPIEESEFQFSVIDS